MKNYAIDGEAYVFTTDYIYNTRYDQLYDPSLDPDFYPVYKYSTVDLKNSLKHIWNMEFAGTYYINNSSAALHRSLPNASIFLIGCHGEPGYMIEERPGDPESIFYANSNSDMLSVDRAISSYAYNELANTYLFISTSCYGGSTDTTKGYGNIIDKVLNKGAMVAIGWTGPVSTEDSNMWTEKLFELISSGHSVTDAIIDTNAYFRETDEYFDLITLNYRYTGNSKSAALVLGAAQ